MDYVNETSRMRKQNLDELITEILVIKDIYVCGRLNQSICEAVSASGSKPKCSRASWEKYEGLSVAYRDDSVCEIAEREEAILNKIDDCGVVALESVFNTTASDFDEDLVNDMMRDFYGSKDTLHFAQSYMRYAEDFNAVLSEFVINETY